ncbi:MAG: four helix bundle protein [Desulfobacterales bacterium]
MKSKINSYLDLQVWKKAMDLVVMCYQITTTFPKNETYGLSSQVQRAAVSVPANIAQGRQRYRDKEFLQHLSIAYGSLAELETHIHIAGRLNYIFKDHIDKILELTTVVGKMLNGLRKSIENRNES